MKTVIVWYSASILIATMLLVGGTLSAQDTDFRLRALRWGGGIGYNSNMASLGYQHLHEPTPNFDKPNTLNEKVNGDGYGIYAGFMMEYLSTSWWGLQVRMSYDQRHATVQDIYATPTTEFITRMDYLTFEPALRVDQKLIPRLSFTGGPIIAANLSGRFDFKADAAGPVTDADVGIPDRSVVSLGVTFGAAYDLEISRTLNESIFLSPFVDYSWIAAQRKAVVTEDQNSVQDIWSTQTIRAGIRISWEFRKPVDHTAFVAPYATPTRATATGSPESKRFYAILPDGNMIVHKSVTGYFPVHPYVFFDKSSQEIPSRYTKLSTADASQFRTDDLGNFATGEETAKQININQLMKVYYNVLNIYGARMRENPSVRVTLRSSDPEDREALASANAVKHYLVNTFGIASNRISIDVDDPWAPSGSDRTNPDHTAMINDENRRVKMVFSDRDMYKAIPYTITDPTPFENNMFINIQHDVHFKSWSVAVTGENQTKNVGPFRTRTAVVDLSSIMNELRTGEYKAAVTIDLADGRRVTENLDFKVYRSDIVKNAVRYLMLFDYNESESVQVYEDILREEIVPNIVSGNTVYVHGHTDIIGNEAGNQTLSQQRADEVKTIMVAQLKRSETDAKVTALGIGQYKMQYTFDNSRPEGRMYNRNVFVEVVK